MAQSLKELCCCTAERPGIFQYIPPVASATPVSIQLGQRLDSLQSSLYSAGVVSRLALLLLCQSDNIARVVAPSLEVLKPKSSIQFSDLLGIYLPRMSSQGLDTNPVNFLALYIQF